MIEIQVRFIKGGVSMYKQAADTQTGWFETLKEKLSPSGLIDKMGGSKQLFVEMGICVSAGFLFGFLLKRYASYLAAFVLFIAVLFVFQHFGIVDFSINWSRIPEIIGVQPATQTTHITSIYFAWMKQNMWLVLSFLVGFLFGLHIG